MRFTFCYNTNILQTSFSLCGSEQESTAITQQVLRITLWKRARKYGDYATGITQNVDDLLQIHTTRTTFANFEFIILLNQASTDRLKLAELLNISDLQMSYITNVEAEHGLIKVGSSLVPFATQSSIS